MLELFLDSADRSAVVPLLETGLFAGVTTNPAILKKAGLRGRDIPDLVDWMTAAGAQRVFVQAWGEEANALIDRGRSLRGLSDRVVVKVAYSPHGVAAASELAGDGDVLVTGIHTAWQAVPVIAARARYIAPFVARMDAGGRDGLAETINVQRALDFGETATQVLAGSVRTPAQILALVQAGVQNITLAPSVWQEFFTDDLTVAVASNFERLAAERTLA